MKHSSNFISCRKPVSYSSKKMQGLHISLSTSLCVSDTAALCKYLHLVPHQSANTSQSEWHPSMLLKPQPLSGNEFFYLWNEQKMIRWQGSRVLQKEVGNLVFIYSSSFMGCVKIYHNFLTYKTEIITLKHAMEWNWFTTKVAESMLAWQPASAKQSMNNSPWYYYHWYYFASVQGSDFNPTWGK